MPPFDASAATGLALKLGGRIVSGLWVLILTAFGLGVAGAVYVTKLDAQITGAVGDIADVRESVEVLTAGLIPGDYLRTWRLELQREDEKLHLEDRRLQVSIDRLEAAQRGEPYNGRGYGGENP